MVLILEIVLQVYIYRISSIDFIQFFIDKLFDPPLRIK